jgi:hypothetical protein
VNRSVLRAALFVISAILLAAAGWSAIVSCNNGVVLRLAIPGLVLLFGLVVERWRYKPVTTRLPGPDWVSTNERFIDQDGHRILSTLYRRAALCGRLTRNRNVGIERIAMAALRATVDYAVPCFLSSKTSV